MWNWFNIFIFKRGLIISADKWELWLTIKETVSQGLQFLWMFCIIWRSHGNQKKVSTWVRIYNMLGLLNHLYSKNLYSGDKRYFQDHNCWDKIRDVYHACIGRLQKEPRLGCFRWNWICINQNCGAQKQISLHIGRLQRNRLPKFVTK
jgi:hypothetical protein